MQFRKFFPSFLLVSIVFALGCNCSSSGTKPSNPFAQNQQTVPPPATFSSQDSYLGQTPGNFVPQTPATTFPNSSAPLGDSLPQSNVTNGSEKATLFSAAEKEAGWTAVATASTSQTAFQAMEAKSNPVSSVGSSIPTDASESLIVGTTHVTTTITDDSQSAPALTEPQLLYSGGHTQ